MLVRGRDENNVVIPVLVNSDGAPIVTVVPNTNGAPYERILSVDQNALPAGASTGTIGTVSTNEQWQIDQLMLRYNGAVAGVSASIRQNKSGVIYVHYFNNAFVTGVWYIFNLSIISGEGSIWEYSVTGATLNDDLWARVYGRVIG